MRNRALVVLGVCACWLAPAALAPAVAHGRASVTVVRVRSPDGRLAAVVRKQARGAVSLWVGGSRLWVAEGSATRMAGKPVWSRRGDALAFVVRTGRGQEKLMVALVSGAAAPATLSWALPRSNSPRRTVTWIGPSKVAVGRSVLAPQMVASWRSRPER